MYGQHPNNGNSLERLRHFAIQRATKVKRLLVLWLPSRSYSIFTKSQKVFGSTSKSFSYLRFFLNEFTLLLVVCSSIIIYPSRLSHCCLVDTYFINSEFLDFKLKDLISLQESSYHIGQKEKFLFVPSPAFSDFQRKYDDSCNQIKSF
jgi:hypothetical protein